MFKIDSPFSTVDNEWQEPNVVTGDPGTRFSADWMNALQRELIGVIEEAGLTPTKGVDDQLLQAIEILVGGGGGGGGSPHWVAPVATTGDLVPGSLNGAICFTLDNKRLYYSNGSTWFLLYDPSNITTLQSQMATRIPLTQKGAASGVAPLNASSKIDAAYLPGFVDDILEYANLAAFPATGVAAKIYVALDTSKTYRWSGSTYTELVSSPGTTDAVVEGSVNLYHTTARAQAAADTQIAAARGAVSGIAPLNSSQKIDSAYLPSYVDDIIEAADFAALPVSGEIGKIYVTLDTNLIYRWSGSAYVQITGSPGTTDDVVEGATNKYFTAERAVDAVGATLTDSATIAFTYDDGANTISAEMIGDIAGGLTPVALVTTSGTSVENTSEPINPVGTGGITRTMPASTADGWSIVAYDVSGACSPADFIRLSPGAGDQFYIPGIGLTSDSLKLRRPNARVTMNQAAGSTTIYVELQGYSSGEGYLEPVAVTASGTVTTNTKENVTLPGATITRTVPPLPGINDAPSSWLILDAGRTASSTQKITIAPQAGEELGTEGAGNTISIDVAGAWLGGSASPGATRWAIQTQASTLVPPAEDGIIGAVYRNKATVSTTFTFNGSGGTTSAVNVEIERIGNVVTVKIPTAKTTSGTASTTQTSNTAIPTWARPSADLFAGNPIVDNGGTSGSATGVIRVTSAGLFTISRDGAGTPWSNSSASSGIGATNCFSYIVG